MTFKSQHNLKYWIQFIKAWDRCKLVTYYKILRLNGIMLEIKTIIPMLFTMTK